MDAEITALLQKVKDAKRTPFWQSTPAQAREGPMLMDLLFGAAPDVARVEAKLDQILQLLQARTEHVGR